MYDRPFCARVGGRMNRLFGVAKRTDMLFSGIRIRGAAVGEGARLLLLSMSCFIPWEIWLNQGNVESSAPTHAHTRRCSSIYFMSSLNKCISVKLISGLSSYRIVRMIAARSSSLACPALTHSCCLSTMLLCFPAVSLWTGGSVDTMHTCHP